MYWERSTDTKQWEPVNAAPKALVRRYNRRVRNGRPYTAIMAAYRYYYRLRFCV